MGKKENIKHDVHLGNNSKMLFNQLTENRQVIFNFIWEIVYWMSFMYNQCKIWIFQIKMKLITFNYFPQIFFISVESYFITPICQTQENSKYQNPPVLSLQWSGSKNKSIMF